MSQMQLGKQSVHDINWSAVEDYLRQEIPALSNEPLKIKPYSAGYSNLTYFIGIGNWEAVLRRPPFGPIPPKAHNMKREYEILEKLNRVFPLAPKPYLYCEDPKIMDRHFYVMEKKEGFVLDDELPVEFEKRQDTGILVSNAVVDTLAKLHEVDYEMAGLGSFGHPNGYLSRQVHSWVIRFHNSKTDSIRNAENLEKWLIENIPPSPAPTIVHNDFKLNNMMFSPANPGEVIGVFDWELSTIGDPLTDLAAALAYWTEEGDEETGLTSVTTKPGFVSRGDLLEMYAQKSGRDVSIIDYYLTFAFYKIAVILQQIYYRWKMGEAKDVRFGRLNIGINNLLKQAERARWNGIFR